MSTSYGNVAVQFPGFKPVSFGTVDDVMAIAHPEIWGSRSSSVHLPSRSFVFKDGSKPRLSRKKRSSLRTLAKKWNKRMRWDDKLGQYVCPFRTLSRNDYN